MGSVLTTQVLYCFWTFALLTIDIFIALNVWPANAMKPFVWELTIKPFMSKDYELVFITPFLDIHLVQY